MQRVMAKVIELRASGSTHRVIVADRSPFSAVLYSKTDGALLEPLIRQFVRELRDVAGVEIVCVHLRTRRELLWRRIQERLRVEPQRMALREDSMDWMDSVLAMYDGMTWDATVPNDEAPIEELRHAVFRALADAASSPGARTSLLALVAAASASGGDAGLSPPPSSASAEAATPMRPRDAAQRSDSSVPPDGIGLTDAPNGSLGVRMALNPAEVSPTQPLREADAAEYSSSHGGSSGGFVAVC